jgi:hypothetical protein
MKTTQKTSKKELEKIAEKVVNIETTKTKATKGVKRNTTSFAKQVQQESKKLVRPLNTKRAMASITPSNFLNPLQAMLVGDITKHDNPLAYANRLMKTTKTLASETKAQLQDILNIILNGMTNEITGQTSIDKIFIDKDVYDRLLFLLPTCIDPSINLKKISFKIVKEAIRSAYRVSMRVVK